MHSRRCEREAESALCLPVMEGLESRLMLSAPLLLIDGPEANYFITQGQPVTVTYTATSDTNALTNFFLNPNIRTYAVDTAIPVANGTNLPNVENGTLTLDTGDLAPGRYFLYGQITDEHGDTYTGTWLGVLFVAPANDAQFSYVRIDTSLGPIVLELDRAAAPMTVANFLSYVNTGFYDDLIVHQSSTPANPTLTGSLILSGSYMSTLGRSTPYTIVPNENVTNKTDSLPNERGTIAMFYPGDFNEATSQFFINLADNPQFNYDPDFGHIWPGYCVFGRVIIGMDVVDAIAALGTTSHGGGLTAVPTLDGSPVTILSTLADRAVATVLLDGEAVTPAPPQELYWPGGCTDMTFTLRNDGAIDMTVGEIVLGNNHGFEVTLQPAALLAPGESTTFVISATGIVDAGCYADVSFVTNGVEGGVFAFVLTDNLAPTADPQNLPMTDSGIVTGTLTGHDVETPAGELTYVIVAWPLHGTVTLVGDVFVYSIGPGYTGSDSFTFAVIDTGYGEALPRTSEPATITIAGGQMVFANAKGVATFIDSAGKVGKVTFKKGTGSLFINDNADGTIGRIFFSGTNDKSSISIATSGKKARVTLYGVECSGPAASIKGPRVDLMGTITLGPAANAKTAVTLSFGTINATIHSATPVKSVAATASTTLDTTTLNLTAPSLKSLSVKGTLEGDITIAGDVGTIKAGHLIESRLTIGGTLKSVTVKGDVTDLYMLVAGAVGTIKAGSLLDSELTIGGTLKNLTVKGTMEILSLTVTGAVGTIKAAEMSGCYYMHDGVKSIAVNGAIMASNIYAAGAVGTIKAGSMLTARLNLQSTLNRLSVSGWVEYSTVAVMGDVNSMTLGGATRSDFGSGAVFALLSPYFEEPDHPLPTGTIKSFTVKGVPKEDCVFFMDSSIHAAAVGNVTVTNWFGQSPALHVPAAGVGKITLKSTAKPAFVYDVGEFVHIL